MQINFSVGDHPVEFTRDPVTGRAEATTPAGTILLQDPFDLGTHFSLGLTKEWRFNVDGFEVRVQKQRPLLLAAFRPSRYRVYVSNNLIIERTGI